MGECLPPRAVLGVRKGRKKSLRRTNCFGDALVFTERGKIIEFPVSLGSSSLPTSTPPLAHRYRSPSWHKVFSKNLTPNINSFCLSLCAKNSLVRFLVQWCWWRGLVAMNGRKLGSPEQGKRTKNKERKCFSTSLKRLGLCGRRRAFIRCARPTYCPATPLSST